MAKFAALHDDISVDVLAVTGASASTVWRWLHDAALKPWQQRSWIYRRDPEFEAKAARVLDLYARVFDGKRLWPNEYVICADEKSQLQALGHRHETSAPAPGRPSRYEFEYERGGTLAYLAAWVVIPEEGEKASIAENLVNKNRKP